MEALQQRHEEFIKRHQDAISKGDSSKARRMDRLAQVIIFSFKKQNFNLFISINSNIKKLLMLHEKVVHMIIVNYQIYLVLHLFLFSNQNLNHHHLLLMLLQHL